MKKTLVCAAAMSLMSATSFGQANLVSDPGFETEGPGILSPSASPWMDNANLGNTAIVAGHAHSGNYAAALTVPNGSSLGGPFGDVLQQPIALARNEPTTISFWYETTGPEFLSADLSSLGGQIFLTPPPNGIGVDNSTYQEFTTTVTPQGSSYFLAFIAGGNPGFTVYLDDVSVTQVPEPRSIALLQPVGVILLCLRRTKRRP
jgi:hypothetical protein